MPLQLCGDDFCHQCQNSKLEAELSGLREDMAKMEESTRCRVHAAVQDSERTVKRVHDDEER